MTKYHQWLISQVSDGWTKEIPNRDAGRLITTNYE